VAAAWKGGPSGLGVGGGVGGGAGCQGRGGHLYR
jgi:hypothetical protein